MKKRSISLLLCFALILGIFSGCTSASVKKPNGKLPASLDDPAMTAYLEQTAYYNAEQIANSEAVRDKNGNVTEYHYVDPQLLSYVSETVYLLADGALIYQNVYEKEIFSETEYRFHDNGQLGYVLQLSYGKKELEKQIDEDGKIKKIVYYYDEDKPSFISDYVYDHEGRLSEIKTEEALGHSIKNITNTSADQEMLTDRNQYSYFYEYDGDTVIEYMQGVYFVTEKQISQKTVTYQKDGKKISDTSRERIHDLYVSVREKSWTRTIEDENGNLLESFSAESEVQSDQTSKIHIIKKTYSSKYASAIYCPVTLPEDGIDREVFQYFDEKNGDLLVDWETEYQDVLVGTGFVNPSKTIRYTYEGDQLKQYVVYDVIAQKEMTYDAEGNLIDSK